MRPPRHRAHVHPDQPCRNCGDPTPGAFCPSCGQRKVDVKVSIRDLAGDFLDDQFGMGRKTPNTLLALFLQPGFLTREYLNGRVVRYLRPLKLYLLSSLVLFLLVGSVSMQGMADIRFGAGASGTEAGLVADSVVAAVREQVQLPLPATDATAEGRPPSAASDTLPEATTPPAPGDRLPWFDRLEVNTGSERLDAILEERAERLGQMAPEDAFRELVRTFIGYVPTLMFLLLPVFAGLLKLLYLRSPLYYAEHFIFVLHTHAFVFGIFSLIILGGMVGATFLSPLLLLGAAIYIFLAMRKVYGQGWGKTALKYWTLGWLYFWVLLIALVPTLVLSIVTGG